MVKTETGKNGNGKKVNGKKGNWQHIVVLILLLLDVSHYACPFAMWL
jgi:hypothetical protein